MVANPRKPRHKPRRKARRKRKIMPEMTGDLPQPRCRVRPPRSRCRRGGNHHLCRTMRPVETFHRCLLV